MVYLITSKINLTYILELKNLIVILEIIDNNLN